MTTKARKVGLYVRLSQDRDGTAAAPARQLADCTALVEGKGWTVHDVYEDRDQSAYSTTAKRPEYKRMLADLEAGVIDAVCVWKFDRLARRLTEANRVAARIDELGAVLLSVNEQLDTSTPMGRAIIGFQAAQAETESANTSARVRRAVADQIAQGRMPKGGSRCFGYTIDGDVIEHEAAQLRQAAQWFIEGVTYRQVAMRLNEAGSTTTGGRPWPAATLRRLLLSPRVGGYRLAEDRTSLVRGAWSPILDHETFTALRAATAKAKRPAERSNEYAHLMTGLARCGKCDGLLRHLKYLSGSGNVFPRLSCVKEPGRGNCGSIQASEAAVDRFVVDQLMEKLESEPVVPGLDFEAIRKQLGEDRTALDDLNRERFIKRTVDQATFETLSAELTARIEQAERDLTNDFSRGVAMNVRTLTAHMVWIGARAKWEHSDLAAQRSLLRAHIERVIIHPAKRRGGNVFDDSRVEIVWR